MTDTHASVPEEQGRELTEDEKHLARLGYSQDLNRSWSGLESRERIWFPKDGGDAIAQASVKGQERKAVSQSSTPKKSANDESYVSLLALFP